MSQPKSKTADHDDGDQDPDRVPRRGVTVTNAIRPGDNHLLTIAEVASRLGVAQRYVRTLIAEGRLRAIRLGPRCMRVSEHDFARLIAERRSGGREPPHPK